MKCTVCHQEIQGEANFCPYCGNHLEKNPEPMEIKTEKEIEIKAETENEKAIEKQETTQSTVENSHKTSEKINPLVMVALGLIILAVISPMIMPIINYEGTWQGGSVTIFTISGVTDIEAEHLFDESYSGGSLSTFLYCLSFVLAAATFCRVYLAKKGYVLYGLTLAGFCFSEYKAYQAFSERFVNYYSMNASIGIGFVIALLALMVSLGLIVYYQKSQMS